MSTSALTRRQWGGGARRALLLHGSTSSSATWWRAGPALADRGWSVTALDLPSHGASHALGVPADPGALAVAVAAELTPETAAAPGRRYDLLLGHSLGALVALVLLAARPELAAALVLEEPAGPNSSDWAAEADAVERSAAQARRDPAGELARAVAAQPRWEEDCHRWFCTAQPSVGVGRGAAAVRRLRGARRWGRRPRGRAGSGPAAVLEAAAVGAAGVGQVLSAGQAGRPVGGTAPGPTDLRCDDGRVTPVARLVTFLDVDDGNADARTMAVSARQEAVLGDGRRVLLLDDRGWGLSGPPEVWAVTSVEDVVATARVVVGPDEPFGGRSHEDMQAEHWASLAGVLRRQGVVADAAELRRVSHDVVLSERLLAHLGRDPGGAVQP